MTKGFKPALAYHVLTPLYDRATELIGYGASFKRRVLELAQIQDGEHVLDVGTGSGTFLIEVKRQYPHSEVTGVDPDEEMLNIAERKLEQAGVEAHLVRGFAQELPFPGNSFDVVVSTLTFHHLSMFVKVHAMKEIYRVLKENARFLLADFGKPDTLVETVLLNIGSIFDGRENMRANLEGKVPKFLRDAGFDVREVASRYQGVQFLLASK